MTLGRGFWSAKARKGSDPLNRMTAAAIRRRRFRVLDLFQCSLGIISFVLLFLAVTIKAYVDANHTHALAYPSDHFGVTRNNGDSHGEVSGKDEP